MNISSIVGEAPYHIPVMRDKCIEGLQIRKEGVYVDATFGGGGHSRAILQELGEDGRLLGFDQDEDAMANALPDKRFTFVRSNFRYLENFLMYYGIDKVDGILADLGVSSHHLDDPFRGFSFRNDAPLDMRMNSSAQLTAAQVVNDYSEEQLADLFYLYGELKQSRKLAQAIMKQRATAPINTTAQLAAVVRPFCSREREAKELARIFQALRIEVNGEMEALREMLQAAIRVLKPGGRLAVITYHSLEDRLVKNIIRTGNIEGHVEQDFYGRSRSTFSAVNSHVIVPTEEEQKRNPRSRSAKLRIAERNDL